MQKRCSASIWRLRSRGPDGRAQQLRRTACPNKAKADTLDKTSGTTDLDADTRQGGNQQWWTENTMSYDWKERAEAEKYSEDWYRDIDARFLHGARLFSADANPFEAMIGTSALAGKRVLEIGCGMGMHSEMMLRAGAKLTSIDLSPTSVASTTKRLELRKIPGADVRLMDAEKLEFADGEFDLVWSWGVIHHSASTARALREVHRVLKPGGGGRRSWFMRPTACPPIW